MKNTIGMARQVDWKSLKAPEGDITKNRFLNPAPKPNIPAPKEVYEIMTLHSSLYDPAFGSKQFTAEAWREEWMKKSCRLASMQDVYKYMRYLNYCSTSGTLLEKGVPANFKIDQFKQTLQRGVVTNSSVRYISKDLEISHHCGAYHGPKSLITSVSNPKYLPNNQIAIHLSDAIHRKEVAVYLRSLLCTENSIDEVKDVLVKSMGVVPNKIMLTLDTERDELGVCTINYNPGDHSCLLSALRLLESCEGHSFGVPVKQKDTGILDVDFEDIDDAARKGKGKTIEDIIRKHSSIIPGDKKNIMGQYGIARYSKRSGGAAASA